MSYPGPLGSKRRRMRSGGSKIPTIEAEENISEQKTTQTSKCKGATTIPIFLKKTYKMVDTCDPAIASWSESGEMFIVKDPDTFATEIIPQFFDHNKFSSFARQLNFYGFRKMQQKPIKNSDYDANTAKHVTFFNENFQRGRCDLLKKIQRSTRGGGAATGGDQSREIAQLKDQVAALEGKVAELEASSEERVRRLEITMLSRMEQMILSFQQQQQQQQQQQPAQVQQLRPTDVAPIEKGVSVGLLNSIAGSGGQWEADLQNSLRGTSISSLSIANAVTNGGFTPRGSITASTGGPTLPPHPKQKQSMGSTGLVVDSMPAPPNRGNSLRGLSTASRGVSSLMRGTSVESAILNGNTLWEDRMFSQIMLDGNEQSTSATMNTEEPVIVSEDCVLKNQEPLLEKNDDIMSDVSV